MSLERIKVINRDMRHRLEDAEEAIREVQDVIDRAYANLNAAQVNADKHIEANGDEDVQNSAVSDLEFQMMMAGIDLGDMANHLADALGKSGRVETEFSKIEEASGSL